MARINKILIFGLLAVLGLAAYFVASSKYWQSHVDSRSVNNNAVFQLSCNHSGLSYAFRYQSQGSMDDSIFNMAALGTRHMQSKASGSMLISCLQEEPEQIISQISFSDIHYTGGGMGASIAVELEGKDIFIQWLKTGEIKSIVFGPSVQQMEKHIVRDILSHLSIRVEAGRTQWQSQEEDINGTYIAQYEFLDEHILEKKRRRYLSMSALGGSSADQASHIIVNPASSSRITLAPGFIQDLESQVNLQFSQNGKVFASNSSSFFLSFQAAVSLAKVTAAFDKYQSLLQSEENQDTLSAASSRQRLELQLQKNTLGDEDWDSLSDKLDQADRDDLTALYLKFKALFILQPEACALAADELLSMHYQDARFHMLASALVQAGHESSQLALLEAALNHPELKSQLALIGQLGLFDKPSEAIETSLKELKSSSTQPDLVQTARLALANIARSVKASATHRYVATLRENLADLIQCDHYVACINALHVLGNLGAGEVLSLLPRFLEASDPTIRAASLSTLRFVEESKAEELLLKSLQEDEDAEVRRAAALELSFRYLSQSAIDIMLAQLQKELSEAVRVQILASMAKDVQRYPSAMNVIKSLAKNDSSRNVRHQAKNLLLSLGGSI